MMTKLRTLGAAAVLALGISAQALAAPIFTVNASSLGGPAGNFSSDQIAVSSSTLITLDDSTNPDSAHGAGWLKFNSFAGVAAGTSLLDVTYQVWGEFEYDLDLISGNLGEFGSQYSVTSLTFTLYGASGFGATFTQATAAGGAATVTPNTPVSIIGGGSLITIPGLDNVVDVNAGGGAAFNAAAGYANNPLVTFFVAPNPFFNVALSSITNDAGAFTRNGDFIALQGAGTITFAKEVPEPATLGLMGLGLLGLGAVSKRRKA